VVIPPPRNSDAVTVARKHMIRFGQKDFPFSDASGDSQYRLGDEEFMPF
jgi:hypothetical protein